MVEQRLLTADEVFSLESCIQNLARYHNEVSQHFKGIYPMTSVRETLQAFKAEVEQQTGIIYALFIEGKIIGFCKLKVKEKNGSLDYLFVEEPHRSTGYGHVLMDWAMKEFAQHRVEKIDVHVIVGNPATALYEKYGFLPQQLVMTKYK